MPPKVVEKAGGAAAPFRRVRKPSQRLARLAVPLDEVEEPVEAPPKPRGELDDWLAVAYEEWLATHPANHPDAGIVRGLVRAIRRGEEIV